MSLQATNTATTPPLFELAGVSFASPGFAPALELVSFQVAAGERVALLGANGSGKSTLLLLLDALVFPTAGTIRMRGEPLTRAATDDTAWGRRFRQEVGLLFQQADAQLFSPSVEEELAFAPLQLGLPAADVARRVDDALAMMDLAPLRRRPPQTLSAGQQKRVALGALLTAAPRVLLLDEPTAGLDPRHQARLLELLAGLSETGMTLITATHDLTLLPHLADRALVLDEEHRLAASGPVHDILHETELLARVNLIHAHPHRHGEVLHVHPHTHIIAHDHGH